MSKEKIGHGEISFRPACPEDARVASRLIFETFPQKATFIIGLGDENRARRILRKLFQKPKHRLSYSETEMAFFKGRIIGLFTAFSGRRLAHLDRKLDLLVLKEYSLRDKIAIVSRGWPLIFIKEANRREFFLSNLIVKKRFRNRGIGEHMLSCIEENAKDAGFHKVSLMVAIENAQARRFYENHGFKTAAIHLESNKRVAHLGAGYQRMVKELS